MEQNLHSKSDFFICCSLKKNFIVIIFCLKSLYQDSYGSLFSPLNKTNKKGNWDFLSHNSDFILTIASLHFTILTFLFSELQDTII